MTKELLVADILYRITWSNASAASVLRLKLLLEKDHETGV